MAFLSVSSFGQTISDRTNTIHPNLSFEHYEKKVAITKLVKWYDQVEKSEHKSFKTILHTISINYDSIHNYFDNRSTYAAAESFNAKIKACRSRFRGVKNVEFFLFSLTNIYS
jgi:transposase